MQHLSLFSGIGGLDLAAEAAGFETVGQCEWADYARAVLEKHWPGIPRWRDIRTLTGEDFYAKTGLRTVDIISGGFPCQPFSTAGKRRGEEDDRYLWPEMLRVIQEIRPRWVVGENVAGIVSMALDTVLSDLEAIGYTCEAVVIPACAVDAPHRRDRVAILAYTERNGQRKNGDQPRAYFKRNDKTFGKERKTEFRTIGCGGGYVPNANCERFQIAGHEPKLKEAEPENRVAFGSWWATEPNVGRVANGVSNRVDRLRCLGNAVVPQQFYPIFAAIAEIERKERADARDIMLELQAHQP